MQIYFDWPFGWYYLTIILVGIWVGLMAYRKNFEMRTQLISATSLLGLAFVIEFVAVSNGVWSYIPGNWPLILWPHYFLSGLVAYQIIKVVEGKKKR